MAATIRRRDTGDTIVIDGVTASSPSQTWTITDRPVDGGGRFTDHAQRQSQTLTISANRSWTPGIVPDAIGQDATYGPGRVQGLYDALTALGGVLLDVVLTDQPGLRSCMIESVTPQSQVQAGALFSLAFREVVVVERRVVAGFAAPAPQPNRGLTGTKDAGAASTKPTQPGQRKSMAAAGLDFVGG